MLLYAAARHKLKINEEARKSHKESKFMKLVIHWNHIPGHLENLCFYENFFLGHKYTNHLYFARVHDSIIYVTCKLKVYMKQIDVFHYFISI